MTDAEFYERQRQINESYRSATLEQIAAYNDLRNVTQEECSGLGFELQNDPYLVKLEEMEQRKIMEPEKRFTQWCRGARIWNER